MTVGNRILRLQRPVHDVGPDVEHGRCLFVLAKELVERVVGTVGSVVETHPVASGLRDVDDIGRNVALGLRTYVKARSKRRQRQAQKSRETDILYTSTSNRCHLRYR